MCNWNNALCNSLASHYINQSVIIFPVQGTDILKFMGYML